MSKVAVVLAAGQGTRMNSDLPKVVHRAAGRPLINWALEGISGIEPDRTMVVVGHGAERVLELLPPEVEHVVQEPQGGTGHAVQVALDALGDLADDDIVVISYGDMPLVSSDTYMALASLCEPGQAAITSVLLDDPRGYGRVMRDSDGRVVKVVEERDAAPEELQVRELNAGLYAFAAGDIRMAVSQLRSDNAQGELYLTDVIGILSAEGVNVATVQAEAHDLLGVNTHAHLAEIEEVLRRRINQSWMERGVRMIDPSRTYVGHDVTLAAGVILYPGCHLEDGTVVEAGAVVGPDVFASESRIGPRCRVWYSVLRGAVVGEGAQVGPFASLRPGVTLEAAAKAGTFVEMKNTTVREGAKVPHLSYLGDAEVGEGANVGAGTITCNYDGFEKHETHIGAGAFIGSDTMLVAPVRIGDGAMTGAGSVITKDVEPGALGMERSEQTNIQDFAARREARYRASRSREEA